jgi:hypothetical protein
MARAVTTSVVASIACVGLVAGGVSAVPPPNHETIDSMFCMQRSWASACYHGGAQTFTADLSGPIDWVELPMSRRDFTTLPLAVEIRGGSPSGTTLATSSLVVAADIPVGEIDGEPTDYAWIRFTFPGPVAVAAGDPLAIVIPPEPMTDSPDPAWGWGKANSDVYPNGGAFGGVGWDTSWQEWWDGSDFAFRTSVNTSMPTPELDLVVNTTGGADPKAGTVTISGSVVCAAEPVDYGLSVSVAQQVGRLFTIRGDGWASGTCETALDWSVIVTPYSGLFKPGVVKVQASVWYCDVYGQCGDTSTELSVKVTKRR